MSYSPLQINAMGTLLQNIGLRINPNAVGYMGTSVDEATYTPGSVVSTTCLGYLSQSIRLAYDLINEPGVSALTYDNLIHIGSNTIPALGNSPPTFFTNLTYTDEMTSYGFLRLAPWSAYKSFYINTGSYSDFLSTINTCYGKKTQLNGTIAALSKSQSFLDGTYSNMNDLISGDITGVNLSTFYWGQDLIASGRAIDLTTIQDFGYPDNLLRTLNKNNALTKAVNLALLSAGLNATDITTILSGQRATDEQQKLMYGAFCIITNNDLADVCTLLNFQASATSLADLLNPKVLFPNSYSSLTFPTFNAIPLPTNSKTYHLIYASGSVDIKPGLGIGDKYRNIIPADIAYSAEAFSVSMLQIKNIQAMSIEKFAQVVMNLENVNGLGVNGTNVPTNTTLASAAYGIVAKGSGVDNTYTMFDFFGTMTDLHYPWQQLQELLIKVQTSSLTSTYIQMFSLLNGPGPYYDLQGYIDQANAEIIAILGTDTEDVQNLISTYATIAEYIQKELDARALALPGIDDLTSTPADVVSFIDNIGIYGNETAIGGMAPFLENIVDPTTANSLIGSLREARNSSRLALTGAVLDNDVTGDPLILPKQSPYTPGTNPNEGYDVSPKIANTPVITGAAIVPGSLAGSKETTLIPPNLSIVTTTAGQTILTPEEAIADVILCNCDCWDML